MYYMFISFLNSTLLYVVSFDPNFTWSLGVWMNLFVSLVFVVLYLIIIKLLNMFQVRSTISRKLQGLVTQALGVIYN